MAVTLNEYLKNEKSPMGVGIIKNLLRQSDILKLLPFEPIPGLRVKATRWQTLPSTGTRKLGGSYTESSGVKEQLEETLHIYGGDVQIDRILKLAANEFEDELADQMAMKGQSLASKFNDDFINGDHAVDPDTFEGLKKRVANAPARMTISCDPATDSLKVLASAANEHTFIDKLHEAVHKVGGGQQGGGENKAMRGLMLMNETSYLGVSQVLRRLGLLDTTKDNFERSWDKFKGFALVDVGLKSDQSTAIITDTEATGDGGTDGSSIYVVRLGEDDGLHGIQLKGTSPTPYDPVKAGEGGASGPNFMRRIDWAIGLRSFGSYSIARVNQFKMAAS